MAAGKHSSRTSRRNSRKDRASIAVADDHDIARNGLVAILSRDIRFTICGQAADEKAALELVERKQPDLLILDLFLGRRDGIVLIKDIAKRFSSTSLLIVCDRGETTYARRVLRAGASGLLMKDAPAEQLIRAIDTVLAGKIYLSSRCQLSVSNQPLSAPGPVHQGLDKLSDRELHVFQLTGTGLGTSAIAQELGLSRKTVDFYRENIKWKLGYPDSKTMIAAARDLLKS